jgi:hypothetical protein
VTTPLDAEAATTTPLDAEAAPTTPLDAEAAPTTPLDAEYVLPLAWNDDDQLADLTAYLTGLVRLVPVTVVDGSPPQLAARHRAAWPQEVRQLAPEPWPGPNGKVAGVMTGVRAARADHVVVADDDVRYDAAALRRIVALLDGAELVRPQNVFAPVPWHARWDTGRSLLNRALGSDYPGTLGVRRSALLAAGGYDGGALFENLELIRTLRATGAREVRADDLYVVRRPPTARHFLGQRVRQAYDDFAQPARLAAELTLLPLGLLTIRRPRVLMGALLAVVAFAEAGRRRAGGPAIYPRTAALWAPLWLAERALCVWLAVGSRLRGGVRYRGARVRLAAHSVRSLRRRNGSGAHA